MKKNIAIVAGGFSSEFEVSLRSANGIYKAIDRKKYNPYIAVIKKDSWDVLLDGGGATPIDRSDFSFVSEGQRIKIDYAYITIHGTPGENGQLQGYFDMTGIPYSSCDVFASALTFNKFACNKFLGAMGVRVADSLILRRGEPYEMLEIVAKLGVPVFVKPNDNGSSFGVSRVNEPSQLKQAIDHAFAEGNEVMIERFIPGTEVTCGCFKAGNEMTVLPVTEVVPKNEFFDYGAKYNGEVQEITPARISDVLRDKVQQTTSYIYKALGAKGIIRVDYIIPDDGEPVMLEVNTTPGMTETSFIPQQVRAMGLNMTDVLTLIIENE
ncbi:MAG: D-alanine--D-alanine ligase [Tannerella sp.]|jgi:D-alanine-D-alanine ligase|nr:D-alanine--D-alanine ligase [Tannerella sp.]